MKYQGDETIKKVADFTAEMTADPSDFWKHCSVHHIACLLDVHRDTIYEWQRSHPEFSDAIKRWEEKRNALFLELKLKNGAWIFLAKNWLEMTDRQEIEHGGSLKTDNKLIVEVVEVKKSENND